MQADFLPSEPGYFDNYFQILELFPPLEEKNSSMTFL